MHAVRYSQTRCSHLSLADCCTQTVDCCPLFALRYSFLTTFSSRAWYLLYIARLLLITATCSPLTPFSLMLPVPLKRSVVFQFHIAFRFSVPVSRCPLLAIRFFCLVACYSSLVPFLLFGLYSLLGTRCWSCTVNLFFVFVHTSCCSLSDVSSLVLAGCNWLFAGGW